MSRAEEIVYGVHPVLEILQSDRAVLKIYLALHRGEREAETIRLLAQQKKVPLAIVHREELNRIAGTIKHQGVLAMVSAESYHDVDALLSVAAKRREVPFLLLLDGVEDPRNLGAILRTAEAAGVHGVILPKRRAAGLSPVVAKTSAGAVAHLPIARVTNLSQTIDQLQKGEWGRTGMVIGMDANAPVSYTEADFRGPVVIVAGSEGAGMHSKIMARCDRVVSLPMSGVIASLNVSVAVGVIVYEVLRQRQKGEKQ